MYHLAAPIIAAALYHKYIDHFKYINIDKNALFALSVLHNAALSAFSLRVFIKMVGILCKHGIVFRSTYYFGISEFDELAWYFYLSKYYEFADIILVVLQKKEPVFLQKFHHVGAIFCWHLCYVYKVDAIWTANLINSLVHTVMYAYYLLSMYKLPYIKKVKMAITSLQLVQLSSSVVLCPYAYYPPVESRFKYSIVMVFNAYVCALIVLFVQFSIKTYGYRCITKSSNL